MPPIAECERARFGFLKFDSLIREIPVGERETYILKNGRKVVLQSEIDGFWDLTTGRYYQEGDELLLTGRRIVKATRENRILHERKVPRWVFG